MKLFEMTALELSRLLQKEEVSAAEVTQSFLERTGELEPQVQAYITRTPENARAGAKMVDKKRRLGDTMSALAGIPLAVKDNICTGGTRTTCGSRFLEEYIPPVDATVVTKTRNAGMPLLGKTNLDEFGMGSTTENSAFHLTRNPWDLQRVPGGSSGGSAAAVAAGMAPLALGTDTGGSVIQPAAFCGLVGLRPTYGRVSRAGLVPLASSLDQAGLLTLTAADAAVLLGLIAGEDQADPTSSSEPVADYLSQIQQGVKGLRVGLLAENITDGFDPEITAAVHRAAAVFSENGAAVEELALPHAGYCLEVYHLLCAAEASSSLGRFDGLRYGSGGEGENVTEMYIRARSRGFGPEVKRRILLGTSILRDGFYEPYYRQAQRLRTLIRRDYEAAFKKFDLLLEAAAPTTAYRLGEKRDDPVAMFQADICVFSGPLAGIPALTLPGGLSMDRLPIGVQLKAAPFHEGILFRAAHLLEQERGPAPLRPQLLPPAL